MCNGPCNRQNFGRCQSENLEIWPFSPPSGPIALDQSIRRRIPHANKDYESAAERRATVTRVRYGDDFRWVKWLKRLDLVGPLSRHKEGGVNLAALRCSGSCVVLSRSKLEAKSLVYRPTSSTRRSTATSSTAAMRTSWRRRGGSSMPTRTRRARATMRRTTTMRYVRA